MRIFVGHDSRFPEATKTCIKSIRDAGFDGQVDYLCKTKLKEIGFYGREDVEGESTEFSFTRFYIPMICNYEGKALFCDNDFLWRCDPREIGRYMGQKPLGVVKHPDYKASSNKMNGVVNKSYPKKNWSSLMLFSNKFFKNKLSKEYLDNARPDQLHEFKFINDAEIVDLPRRYNCLVGHEGYDTDKARALHYTNGGPWFEEYKNAELSEEWLKTYKSL